MDLLSFYGSDEVEAAVRNLAQDRQEVEEQVKSFVRRLAKICTISPQDKGWGVLFKIKDDGTTADLDTPFGPAWTELTIGIDAESKNVQGFWSIWKRVYDEDGQQASSLVTTIRISGHGRVFLGGDHQGSLSVSRSDQRAYDKTAEQVMAAILYALGVH